MSPINTLCVPETLMPFCKLAIATVPLTFVPILLFETCVVVKLPPAPSNNIPFWVLPEIKLLVIWTPLQLSIWIPE